MMVCLNGEVLGQRYAVDWGCLWSVQGLLLRSQIPDGDFMSCPIVCIMFY